MIMSPMRIIARRTLREFVEARRGYKDYTGLLKGNDYRLVLAIDFEKSIVSIKWIGTHKDYDKINVKEVRHGR